MGRVFIGTGRARSDRWCLIWTADDADTSSRWGGFVVGGGEHEVGGRINAVHGGWPLARVSSFLL